MLKVLMGYPSRNEEMLILDRFTEGISYKPKPVISTEEIQKIQKIVPTIYADIEIKKYITSLVDATRNPSDYQIPLGSYIRYGASPRASIYLMLGAKAHALLRGRGYVLPDDVKAVAHDVLRHRILLTYLAEAEEIVVDSVIDEIIRIVPIP